MIGTDGPKKQEFLRATGVDEPTDYTSTDVFDAVSDIDVVLDLIRGATGRRSLAPLRPGGLLVCVPTDSADEVLTEAKCHDIRARVILVVLSV